MAEPDQTNADAEPVSDIVARLRAAIDLAERMGIVGSHPTNIHRIAIEAADFIEAQSKALAEARAGLKKHLSDHWLTGVTCDHGAKTDTAACSCSMWRDEPHPSVGAAVEAWIEHVFTTLPLLTPTPENPNG